MAKEDETPDEAGPALVSIDVYSAFGNEPAPPNAAPPPPLATPQGAMDWAEVRSLHARMEQEWRQIEDFWVLYFHLYAGSQKRVSLLNEVSGFVFANFERALVGAVIVGLMRLLDKDLVSRKETASLVRLCKEIHLHHPTDRRTRRLLRVASWAVHESGPIRSYRNKWLVHSDLHAETVGNQLPITRIVRLVRIALDQAGAFFGSPRRVWGRFSDPSFQLLRGLAYGIDVRRALDAVDASKGYDRTVRIGIRQRWPEWGIGPDVSASTTAIVRRGRWARAPDDRDSGE